MRACGRNDFSDATQPISLVDYAEIIDLHSWFKPPTTRALVTGNGHAWSRVNHGSYRGHGTAGWLFTTAGRPSVTGNGSRSRASAEGVRKRSLASPQGSMLSLSSSRVAIDL